MINKKCKICGEEKKGNIYKKTCGKKECVVLLKKRTNIERFGHECNLHGIEGKNKVLKTLKEKYGEKIVNVSQIEEVKVKKQKTCLKNHGVNWPMQSKEILNKSKSKVLLKYGVDNVSKCREIIDKIKNKLYEIDPKTNKTILEKALIKREKNCLEKYGFKYYFQTEEFKEKLKNKMLKKYGVENYFQTDEFFELMGKEKIKNHTEFQIYSKKVRNLTEKTFKENFDLICILFFRGKEYHLDHIFSVYEGFINSIEPEIISSVVNLQLLPRLINLKKSFHSWQTLEELMEKYEKLTKL
jgi:hypothetical protein